MSRRRVELSVIITCHFEEKSIDEFHQRLSSALQEMAVPYEIVFVNDGSTDATFDKLKAIFNKDANVSQVIELFRNSGQLGAMTAGIANAQGEHFVFIDSDLQLNPEDLPLLYSEFCTGVDIVSGYRKDRKDPLHRVVWSKVANVIMRRVSGHRITDFGCTFKIYNGKLIRAFEFGRFRKFQPAYVYAKAKNYREVAVAHEARRYGKSGWTFLRLSSFLMDNIVGMTRRPFQLLSLLCLIGAAFLIVRVVSAWLMPFSILPEVTTGLLLNVLLVHLLVTVAVLSAIGEYVIRNFASLQANPVYIIRQKLERAHKQDG